MSYLRNQFSVKISGAVIGVLVYASMVLAATVEVPLDPQVIMGQGVSVSLISKEDLGKLGKRNNHEVSIDAAGGKGYIDYGHDQMSNVVAQKFTVDVSIPSAGAAEQNAYAVMHADFRNQGLNTIIVTLDVLRQKINVAYYILWVPTVFEESFQIENDQVYTIVISRDKNDPSKNYVRADERFDRLPNSGDPIISFVKTFDQMGITLTDDNLDYTFHGVGSNNSRARFWRASLTDTTVDPILLSPCLGTKCAQMTAESLDAVNSGR